MDVSVLDWATGFAYSYTANFFQKIKIFTSVNTYIKKIFSKCLYSHRENSFFCVKIICI